MVPCPIALGLTLCDQVIVEEGTRKVSVIGGFTRLHGSEFPFTPPPFCVYATLTGSQGEGEITLTVTDLETDQEVFSRSIRATFSDRFNELGVLFRLSEVMFPEPSHYMFTMTVDNEWVVHRRVAILEQESDS